MRKFLFILAFFTLLCSNTYAQRLALSTDVAMDALGAPSFGIEMTMTQKSTLNLSAFYADKLAWSKDLRMFAAYPEWRYYFSGRPMNSWYIGAAGIFTTYDFTLKGKVYNGHAFGAGMSFGYVYPITKRLQVSAHSSAGLLIYQHKEYFVGDDYEHQYTNMDGYTIPNAKGTLLIPFKLGIALSYILK